MALVQHGSKRSGDQNTNALKRIQLCCASSLIRRQLAAGSLILPGRISRELTDELHKVDTLMGTELAQKLRGGLPVIALNNHELFAFPNQIVKKC